MFDLAAPAHACACGAPAPVADDPNGDVMIGHEYAVISLHGMSEQVDMRLSVNTMARDSGLIMPTPAPAKVSLGDPTVFDALAAQTTPRVVTEYRWWSALSMFAGSGGAAPRAEAPPVQVLDEVQLGPLDAVTLAASDAAGLTAWLDNNGYGVRSDVADLLNTYIDKNWYFVAIKLTNDTTLDGDLDPIRFTFDTPTSGPVYPLALSQAAREAQTVNLYVFDQHQRDVVFAPDQPIEYWAGGQPTWSGAVTEPSLLAYGSYLTAYTLYFNDPHTQILGDLAFPQAKADIASGQVVERVVYVTVLGIPAGWLLVTVGMVALILVWRGLARRRRTIALRQPRYDAEAEAAMKEVEDILAHRVQVKTYTSVDEMMDDQENSSTNE